MSIYMRAQLLRVNPNVLRLAARNAPKARRVQSLALALPAPARPLIQRRLEMVTLGAFLSAGVVAMSKNSVALCEELDALFATTQGPSGGNGKDGGSIKDDVDRIFDHLLSHSGEITLSGCLGFCSGYAVKEVGKIAAVTIGTLFVLIQFASRKGYVNVNWEKVQKDMVAAVDPDKDGKITKKDVRIWYNRLMDVLKENLPSSAGFAGGFALGIACT